MADIQNFNLAESCQRNSTSPQSRWVRQEGHFDPNAQREDVES